MDDAEAVAQPDRLGVPVVGTMWIVVQAFKTLLECDRDRAAAVVDDLLATEMYRPLPSGASLSLGLRGGLVAVKRDLGDQLLAIWPVLVDEQRMPARRGALSAPVADGSWARYPRSALGPVLFRRRSLLARSQ